MGLVRYIRGKIVVNGETEITGADTLQSFSFDDGNTDSLIIGNTACKQAKIVLIEPEGTACPISEGDSIELFISNQETEDIKNYISIGRVTVHKLERSIQKRTVNCTCYDAMQKFNSGLISEVAVSFPCTLREYVSSICEYAGVPLSGKSFYHDTLEITEEPNQSSRSTLRQVIGKAAECAFSNAYINRTGQLEFLTITQEAIERPILPSDYFSLDVGPTYGPVNSLVLAREPVQDYVYAEDVESISTNGKTELKITDNPFLDAIRYDVVQEMLQEIDGFTYTSYSLEWCGNESASVYEKIAITDIDGKVTHSFILGASVMFNGGMKWDIQADAMSKEDSNTSLGNTLRDTVKDTYIEVDKVKGQITSLASEQQEIQVSNDSRFEELEQRIQTNQTLIEQTANQIKASMSETGGSNMLANSVGYKDLAFWETSDPISYQIIQDAQTDQHTTSGSGIQLINGTIRQSFYTQQGMQYAVQFAYNKAGVASAESSVVLMAEDTSIDVLRTTQAEDGYQNVLFVFEAQQPEYTLVISTSNDAFAVYDLRITAGDSGQAWSQGKDEVYGKGVLLDKTGVTINPLEAGSVSMTMDNDSLYISDSGTLKAEVSDDRIYGQYMTSETGIRIGDVEIRGLTRTRLVLSGV